MQKVKREAAIRGSARRSERKGYDFSAQRQAAGFEPPGASGREEIRGIELGEGETLPQLDGPSVIPILAQAGEAADAFCRAQYFALQ